MTDDVKQFLRWLVDNRLRSEPSPDGGTPCMDSTYRLVAAGWAQSLLDGDGKDWQMEAVG